MSLRILQGAIRTGVTDEGQAQGQHDQGSGSAKAPWLKQGFPLARTRYLLLT